MPRPAAKPKPRQQSIPPHVPEVVAGSWLLKAFGAMLAAAIACVYLALCLLFYQGQWQIVLHPSRKPATASSSQNLVHFDSESTGQPQLAGEFLPAPAGTPYSGLTVLFLPGGDGSRTDSATTQSALQALGLNVFAFDYRGYGQSAEGRPSQQRMTEDSEAAFRYLTGMRGVQPSSIIPYGVGVGASLAAHLAASHHEIRAVILDSPLGDLRETTIRKTAWRYLPTGLLFKEDFPLAEPLKTLTSPKLLLEGNQNETPAFRTAASPKIVVSLPSPQGPQFNEAIRRFLDQYLPVPSPALTGTKQP